MASVAPSTLPTFDDLYRQIEALPEGVTGEILVAGVLQTMSRPAKAHRVSAMRIADAVRGLNAHLQGTGWWIEVEAEIKLLGSRLAVPDLSGWRVERVPELPEENPITIVPDWVCEVLSPGTARDDRRLKLPLYAESDIPWIWLVDPGLRLVEVYESVNGKAVLSVVAAAEDVTPLPPFGLAGTVADLFLAPARQR